MQYSILLLLITENIIFFLQAFDFTVKSIILSRNFDARRGRDADHSPPSSAEIVNV
jgi:hypothetical protein